MKHNTSITKSIKERFKDQYNSNPEIVSVAPGRINIIGEHTDYNYGFAMPAAFNRYIYSAISFSKNKYITLFSMNYDMLIKIPLNGKLNCSSQWMKIVSSVIRILRSEFDINKGANIVVNGDIPIGCGLSSSTAFVTSITQGLCKLYNIDVSGKELAHLCQRIEIMGLDLDIGLLDQYGIILSKDKSLMVIDFHDKSVNYIPVSFCGCSLVVIDSQVNRKLSNSAYNSRVNECREGLDILKLNNDINEFRDIKISMLSSLDSRSDHYKRLLHFINENSRVKEMIVHLKSSNYIEIGKTLTASHESLRNLYEVSCDEIDYIIDKSSDNNGWYGGRIVGGGFGGCSIHLINSNNLQGYMEYISKCYIEKYNIMPDIFEIDISFGAYVFEV